MKVIRLIAINLLVFIGLLGIAVVGIELWLRLQPRSMFIEFDPLLGFRLAPHAQGVYRGLSVVTPNPYIRTAVHINSLGLRGPEIAPTKAPGNRRVLVLGDSFVEAFEVPYEDTFYARLEKMSQQQSAHPVQFISMGVMGYGTAQELLWLRKYGMQIQPDMVVLLLFLGNDIVDNSRALHFSGARPYFELRGNTLELTSLPNSFNRYKYWAAEHIRSFMLYKELGLRLTGLRRILDRFSLSNNPTPGVAPRTTPDLKIHQAFQLTFALIKEMRRTTEELGSPLLVAYYGDFRPGSQPDARSLTAAFCANEGLECVNLNPYVAENNQNFVPGDGHWSATGHRAVADILWRSWGHYFTADASDPQIVLHQP